MEGQDESVATNDEPQILAETAKPEAMLSSSELEKLEEAKLKAKFPNAPGFRGHSAFLQKKLAKGQKYFDSGDYQMAKQTCGGGAGGKGGAMGGASRQMPPQALLSFGTGDAIPTPESVPARKTSIIQPKFSSPNPAT
ncbi:cAMP-regulated phosphoprotein 19-A isoform X2 [Nilaparvata lugens]|uniref:cAMP-regulated phosphoprotein 19-A isoform X2 n=1 Tax=Nilaparvata lugens TaxID=108931 RepID=UPI000B98BAD5|nr:cAMP-regulated phosphoprotein 19-A isoform X2 [Nilaparvata lugens]